MSDIPRRDLEDAELRSRFLQFLQRHYPEEWRDPTYRLRGPEARQWLRLQHEHGWRAPGWPAAYGGMGLSLAQHLLVRQVMEEHRIARVVDMGVTMLGPVLMRYGTDAQKAHYLPRILRCDDVWCQGYSEPNAGSDLASLGMAAVRDGTMFVLDGSKIWTTRAMDATHMFALVRTAKREKRQDGISFLLIPLDSPGITIRPITNLAEEDEFAQVFFQNVRVPVANLVGEADAGWTVAKALLGFERISIGNPGHARLALRTVEEIMRGLGLTDDPAYRDRLVQLTADLYDTQVLYDEVTAEALAGTAAPERFSMLKLLATELTQRVTEFGMEVAGEYAGTLGEAPLPGRPNLYKQFMLSRPGTIYGGSSEVQRNILAKSMLGLPSR